ncbi:hypothetical protein QYF61_022167 [Mycteria americana]|uniref:USP domain-containing protein n=1 Tax=Mycteria americana TaxID=33587 RepID=A0AAN7RT13_MYCAM|nr:hypothetical protein QYF61_022167 [Mycteria americana]
MGKCLCSVLLRELGSAVVLRAESRRELLTPSFSGIGEHFKLGRQEDAHEFLCYTVDAMQRACLSGSSNLDTSSQATTIVHQIFGRFLRSRVTCSSCKADSDSYEAFLDVPLDIKAASSVTAVLEGFVKPEQLDGENCFKCSKCDKMVAASKRFTIHCVPKVLMLCLKRFGDFTGRKISKASNGLWYKMNDTSVDGCGIDTVLRQQAYLLFYVRAEYFKGAYRKDEEGLFIRECSDRTRGNGFKLKEGRFRLDMRKKFFMVRVLRDWKRLPREVVDAPSLEVFKARLDGAFSSLI